MLSRTMISLKIYKMFTHCFLLTHEYTLAYLYIVAERHKHLEKSVNLMRIGKWPPWKLNICFVLCVNDLFAAIFVRKVD